MASIAFILGPEFEDSEFRVPYDKLEQAGHHVTIIGTDKDQTVDGKRGKEHVKIDFVPAERSPDEFDALVIPGGHSPDNIRADEQIVGFVRRFVDSGKPVAAVCHGPQLLIEADVVRGKRMTSWPSVRKDLENAGAHWVDEEVVTDGSLITSRKPDDLEAFSNALLSMV
jgi:protease I